MPYEQEDEVREKERRLMGVEKTSSDEQDCTILEVHTDLDLQGFEHVNPIDGEPTGIKLPIQAASPVLCAAAAKDNPPPNNKSTPHGTPFSASFQSNRLF